MSGSSGAGGGSGGAGGGGGGGSGAPPPPLHGTPLLRHATHLLQKTQPHSHTHTHTQTHITTHINAQGQIVGTGGQTVTGTVVSAGGSSGTTIFQGTQIGGSSITGQGATVRTLPTGVRLLSPINLPLQQHGHISVSSQRTQNLGQTATPKQITTNYHVPRGPAAVASLSVPRATASPRVPTPPNTGWPSSGTQIRPGTLVYAQRTSRPTTLQVATTQRPSTLRQTTPQSGTTTTVVARAVRPANIPSPQRTPPPQVLQTVTPVRTTTKVVPIVQRNFQSAKVVGVATLGVRPTTSPRTVSGTYYYEVSSGLSSTAAQQNSGPSTTVQSLALTTSTHSLPASTTTPSITTSTSYTTGGNVDHTRVTSSPVGPQRPSILRKRDNESNSPVKSQWAIVSSPPPSPGGSTTVSAASSPELDDEEPSLPSAPTSQPQPSLPSFNNCSPRKKPRKQLLNIESRGARGGDCEFPAEGGRAPSAPSPPPAAVPPPAPAQPEAEKPPRRALLGAGWKCGWRANALHFTRPTDVRRREERRPSVVELAAQRQVIQKANGWKVHHLTAQMDDLIILESEALKQATEALRVLESSPQSDLHQICELLKGNIQRSKIVCEGVAEARTNVLRIFQHKGHVSDILARQADKRCFKKHRNQY